MAEFKTGTAFLLLPSPKYLMYPKMAHESLVCGLCFREQRSSGNQEEYVSRCLQDHTVFFQCSMSSI